MLENIMSHQENDLQPRVIYINPFHLFIHSKMKSLMIFKLERRQNELEGEPAMVLERFE